MRKPIIVGNWKMNKTMKETKEFIEAVDPALAKMLLSVSVHRSPRCPLQLQQRTI